MRQDDWSVCHLAPTLGQDDGLFYIFLLHSMESVFLKKLFCHAIAHALSVWLAMATKFFSVVKSIPVYGEFSKSLSSCPGLPYSNR
jgi:hypothetical protein